MTQKEQTTIIVPEPSHKKLASPEAGMAQQSESTALMRIIERAATDKDMDVAKLEKLLDIKRQWDADNARKAFSAAVSEFQARCPTVFKSRKADRGRGGTYLYAPLDEVLRTIRPHLDAAGLAVRFDSEVTETSATAICHLSHRDGHVETSRFTVPIDVAVSSQGNPIMTATQGVGSANTYAKRYALCNALNLVGSEFDDDGIAASGQAQPPEETASGKQLALIEKWREAGKITEKTEAWIKKNSPLTEKQAQHLLDELKMRNPT